MRWIEVSQTNEVDVKGTADTAPFMTAVIQNEIPFIQLSCREEVLRIHTDFKKNDVVKIDCNQKKVVINDRLQMHTIDLFDADFFPLKPGMNEIKTVPVMQLEVVYTERWL